MGIQLECDFSRTRCGRIFIPDEGGVERRMGFCALGLAVRLLERVLESEVLISAELELYELIMRRKSSFEHRDRRNVNDFVRSLSSW